MRRRLHPSLDIEVDLVPLIDCVFLLLLFFILCGRFINDTRDEQVTVPPATTAHTVVKNLEWQRATINLKGDSLRPVVVMGSTAITGMAADVWAELRRRLDILHDQAERRIDHDAPLGYRPLVVVNLRADRNLDWRVVQECQQVLADSIDPRTGLAKGGLRRPLTHLEFAAWQP